MSDRVTKSPYCARVAVMSVTASAEPEGVTPSVRAVVAAASCE
jgi:hypothetical protein